MPKSPNSVPPSNSRSGSISFSMSLPFLRSKEAAEAAKSKASLSQVKLQVELCFQDVESTDADRLRYKIRGTRDVKDLWMLRSDIHQLISRHINQQEAAKRINALLPCFKYWLPTRALIKI